MLAQSVITQVLPLAEQFDAKNYYLQPVAGSPLDYLVQATGVNPGMMLPLDSNAADVTSNTGEGLVVDFTAIADASAAKEGMFDKSRHDMVLEDVKVAAARGVTDTLHIARNIVAPEVTELVELVAMRMQGVGVSDLTQVRIMPVEGDAVYYNPSLMKMLEKYELAPVVPTLLSANLPDISQAEVLEFLKTGVASLDEDVSVWAAEQGDNILSVWRQFFCVRVNDFGGGVTIARRSDLESQLAYWKGSALTVFLIARHLIEEDKLLDGTDMSLNEYRKTLQAYVEQAGRLLCRQIDANNIATKNNVLVKQITGNDIYVNAPVYNSWMANGGDNDVLLGMAISKDRNYTVDAIGSRAEQYRTEWRKHVALVTTRENGAKFNYVRQQMVLCYESMLAKPNAEGVAMPVADQERIMKTFKGYLDGICARDLDDMYHLALTLICKTRYDDTHAYRFLCKMAEVAKQNPSLTPREAGTVATLWYITAWICDMTQVISN